jgi:hypothetical protein
MFFPERLIPRSLALEHSTKVAVSIEIDVPRLRHKRRKLFLVTRLSVRAVEVCPTVCTDPPRAHATRRSTVGFIIIYFRQSSSYECSNYRIEIVKYALCGCGGQKAQTCDVNTQTTLERHDQQ